MLSITNCCILTTIMIPITTVHIQMQIQGNTKHRWLRCSGTNTFINLWLHFFNTRRETILKSLSYHTMLTTPQRLAHLVVQSQFLNTIVGPQLLNIMVGTSWQRTPFSAPLAEAQLTACMVHSQLPTATACLNGREPNWLFSKFFKFSGPTLPGMTSFTLQPHFLSGCLLWQWWLSYPLRTSVNCTQRLCTWTKSWIVQSPIKLNDKI